MGVVVDTASIKKKLTDTNGATGVSQNFSTGGGSFGGSPSSPDDAVDELMMYIRLHTPPQIRDAVEQYRVKTGTLKPKGSGTSRVVAYISFYKNKIKRKSVNYSRYSHGVDNIIALLNNGYEANRSLWGYWHGEKIKTLRKRNGLHFMQKAINDFNRIYGSKHNCEAELSELYQ